jgi:integrase
VPNGFVPKDLQNAGQARAFRTAAGRQSVSRKENRLVEWILSEADVKLTLAAEGEPHDSALLHLLYSAGLRVSELCQLRWRNLQPRGNTGASRGTHPRGEYPSYKVTISRSLRRVKASHDYLPQHTIVRLRQQDNRFVHPRSNR